MLEFRHYIEHANASLSPSAEAGRIQQFRKGLPLSTMPYLVTRMNPGHWHLLSAAVTSKKRYHHRLLWYFATSFCAEQPKDPRQPVKSGPGGCMFTEAKLEKWARRAVVTLARYMLTTASRVTCSSTCVPVRPALYQTAQCVCVEMTMARFRYLYLLTQSNQRGERLTSSELTLINQWTTS